MKTAEQIAEDTLDRACIAKAAHIVHVDQMKTLIADAIEADRAQRDDVIEKVRAYAMDRAVHARHPILNQVGSGRIASDLLQILGLPYPFPEDDEEVESS